MKLLVCCLVVFSLYFANAGNTKPSRNSVEDAKKFKEFIVKYRRYYSADEKEFRFKIFVKNLDKIDELNAESKRLGHNTVFGINHFADQTEDQFHGGSVKYDSAKGRSHTDTPVDSAAALSKRRDKREEKVPNYFDLRKMNINGTHLVGNVKDQGYCGCSWAIAVAAVAESVYALKHKKFVSLSEQEVCDCGHSKLNVNPGCVGGDMGDGINYVSKYGLSDSKLYQYDDGRSQKLGRCSNKRERTLKSNELRIVNFEGENVESEVMTHLFHHEIPVSVFFKSGDILKFYKSGVLEIPDCSSADFKETHQAGAIVGYGSEEYNGTLHNYWIVKNSWSSDWGEKGYFKVSRGQNWCEIETNPVSAVPTL